MLDDTAMQDNQVSFKAGDVIYRQGSPTKGAFLILEGQVNLWREEKGTETHIAFIGGGELLGEVSVIEGRPHSVTAKASMATKALFIPAEDFRKSFNDPLVRHVLHTLAARLRSSYAFNASKAGVDAGAINRDAILIEGYSPLIAGLLPSGLPVSAFPFIVGNVTAPSEGPVISPNQLQLPLIGMTELAHRHFEIVRRDGLLWIKDLGAPSGTIVNGMKLSKYAQTATARLHVGRNSVIAGSIESPARFAITLPPSS